jgi:hypothetical protein
MAIDRRAWYSPHRLWVSARPPEARIACAALLLAVVALCGLIYLLLR